MSHKTEELKNCLEAYVEEFASCGFCALVAAYEEVGSDDFDAEGNGFELIGLLIMFDPAFYLLGSMSTLVTIVLTHRLATSQPNSYVPIVLICQW